MSKLKQSLVIISAILGLAIFFWLGTALPRTTAELFASPDETAALAFGRAWTGPGGFRLPHGLPTDLNGFASLHPRSMVRQGEWLLPVGFLGMPFIVAMLDGLVKGLASYFTVILVMSAVFPLWQITKRVNGRVATLTVLLTLSFPTVILYANRGLFPNLPVVALVLWAVWAVEKARRPEGQKAGRVFASVIAGLAFGLALLIRPIEAIWIFPWVAWASADAFKNRNVRKHCASAVALTVAVCLIGVWLSYKTYPPLFGVLPSFGYAMHDAAGGAPAASVTQTIAVPPHQSILKTLLPFGFHPHAIWSNARIFLFNGLAPWMIAAFLGAYLFLKRTWKREQSIVIVLVGWTATSLLLVYGQAMYADNIQGTMTLGNSFLRYMLPLAPIIAFGCALMLDKLWEGVVGRGTWGVGSGKWEMRGERIMAVVATCLFVMLGLTMAFVGDAEGIVQTKHELQRYEVIRQQAEDKLPQGTIILSDRSDKIFVGKQSVSVSPFPDQPTIDALARSSSTVAVFNRVFTPDGLIAWSAKLNGRSLQPVFAVDNEEMYVVK